MAFHRHGADKNGRATDTKCGATAVSPAPRFTYRLSRTGSPGIDSNRGSRDDALGKALAFV